MVNCLCKALIIQELYALCVHKLHRDESSSENNDENYQKISTESRQYQD